MMYGMHRTTVYLPDELSSRLARTARELARSEASLIREGVELAIERAAPEPRLPLLESGQSDLAERVDELLAGFGER